MDQNLCFNIFIFLFILIVIKYISPKPDSVLFVLKKYLNFLIFKINRFFKHLFLCSEDFNKEHFGTVTFKGMHEFQDKAPSFVTYYQSMFIQKMIEQNPSLDVKTLKNLYAFIEKMVTTDVDDYFLTVSDSDEKVFSDNELNKIKTIILNKLNSGNFKFNNLIINKPVIYYSNISGKEVNPFSFTVDCDHNIGKLTIYISIDIRNDVVKNASYIVIKKIRLALINPEIVTNLNNYIVNNETNINNETNSNINNETKPDIPQPCFYDNPDNLNLKINDLYNYNIDIDQVNIPDYNDILNSYDNSNMSQNNVNMSQNNVNMSQNNVNMSQNNVNMSMPMVDFSKQFKTPINFGSLEASNNDDTSYNLLDNISQFKIPNENITRQNII